MKKINLIETAYDYLCKKKQSSLQNIIKHVKKECNILPEKEEKFVGDLYAGMISNPDFFLKNDNIWCLSSMVSLEEKRNQMLVIDKEVYNVEDNTDKTTDISDTLDASLSSEDEDDLLDEDKDNLEDDDENVILKVIPEEEMYD